MVRVTLLVLLCIISITFADDHDEDSESSFPESETRLLKRLLRRYDPRVRPQEKTEVGFGISLQDVVSYQNEGDGYRSFVFHLWHNLKYNDARLKWNETDYGGVTSVRLPLDDIWLPDIRLYNSMHPFSRYEGVNAVVTSNGEVFVVPTINQEMMCSPDDPNRWRCNLKYGSWTYAGNQLNMTTRGDEVDLSTYSGRFTLESTTCQRNVARYECCPEPYIDITCSIVINGL